MMQETCKYRCPNDGWLCTEKTGTDNGLCTFHDSNPDKEPGAFNARFQARLADAKEVPLRLDGAIIPRGYSFTGLVFERGVSFASAEFPGADTLFDGAIFRGALTSFVGTKFRGARTIFDAAEFHSETTSFSGAEFRGEVTSFVGTKFRGARTILGAKFHTKEAFFDCAEFYSDRTSFDGAKFYSDKTSFDGAKLQGEQTSFIVAEFHGKQTCFEDAGFHSKSTFFNGAQFESQWTLFRRAEFRGEQTSFKAAKFRGKLTRFDEAKFRAKETSFIWAHFGAMETSFIEAEFQGEETSFVWAQFHGQTIFKGTERSKVFLSGTTNFGEISIHKDGELGFDRVDLSRTSFFPGLLLRVKFLDVTWARPQNTWRFGLYDEMLWRTARNACPRQSRSEIDAEVLVHLGRLYLALKTYYQETGEHYLVGHFHYGLMEVRWYQKGKLKKWLSWEGLYRVSSAYGEDYVRAGTVLLGLLVLFAAAFWALGVPSEIHGSPVIERSVHALLYSAQAGTLGRLAFYGLPDAPVARALHLAESILIPIQFGFFAFALRNRFRR